jgi:hypothetical protein
VEEAHAVWQLERHEAKSLRARSHELVEHAADEFFVLGRPIGLDRVPNHD